METSFGEMPYFRENLILLFNPQNDFGDSDGIMGSDEKEECTLRIADHLSHCNDRTYTRVLTPMVSHRTLHICQPSFWHDKKMRRPWDFAEITSRDVEKGIWTPIMHEKTVMDYLKGLEEKGKFHIVYPEHCLLNTWGWNYCLEINFVLRGIMEFPTVELYHYDDNPLVGQFSIFRAEDNIIECPETNLNTELLARLSTFRRVFICGFFSDVHIKESIRDIIDNNPEILPKLNILKDAITSLDRDFVIEDDEVYKKAVEGGATMANGNDFDLFKPKDGDN